MEGHCWKLRPFNVSDHIYDLENSQYKTYYVSDVSNGLQRHKMSAKIEIIEFRK